MQHTTPYVPGSLTQSWLVRLDDIPTDLIWSAMRMPPEIKHMRYIATLSLMPGLGRGTIMLTKLSPTDLDALLTAITEHLKSIQLGMVQSSTRIDTAAGDVLTVMGRLSSIASVTIQLEQAGQPIRMLALDMASISQAIEALQTIRRAFGSHAPT